MTVAWVLGSTGLLGWALHREICGRGAALFSPTGPLSWGQETVLAAQIATAVRTFGKHAQSAGRWEIYWAAGVGTMSSSPERLAPETRALGMLLRLIGSDERLMTVPGGFAFASSAGAIYAGSTHDVVSETSALAPTTFYAHAKLEQEALVRAFVGASGNVAGLIARISTIYGRGQSESKQQGLLTHIARSIIQNRPVQIYVPFDTIRDYIAVDDAAAAIVTELVACVDRQRVVLKIVASEQPTTIAEIISIFRRVSRRKPLVVTSSSRLGGLYSPRLTFQSVFARDHRTRKRTSLLIGIAQLMSSERVSYSSNRSNQDRCVPAHTAWCQDVDSDTVVRSKSGIAPQANMSTQIPGEML
jgi:UDP-glucose 4-epimerase